MKKINTYAEFLNLVFKDMYCGIQSDINNPIQRINEFIMLADFNICNFVL